MDYPVDRVLESFIARATGGGKVIGVARQTIGVLRTNPAVTLRRSMEQRAAVVLIVPQPGEAAPVQARIEYGRWCWPCPLCGNYEDVDPAEPVVLCTACGGESSQFAPVEFPAERAEIERLLLARPLLRNRNWQPGESAAQLAQENALYLKEGKK